MYRWKSLTASLLIIVSDTTRARNRELLSTVICVIPNNMISQKQSIFEIWRMDQKKINFDHLIHIPDETARFQPVQRWRSLTAYFSNKLKYTCFKNIHNTDTSIKFSHQVLNEVSSKVSKLKRFSDRQISAFFIHFDIQLKNSYIFSKSEKSTGRQKRRHNSYQFHNNFE